MIEEADISQLMILILSIVGCDGQIRVGVTVLICSLSRTHAHSLAPEYKMMVDELLIADGLHYMAFNRPAMAVEVFTSAIRLDETRGSHFVHRAKAWSSMSDLQRALVDLNHAVLRDPFLGDVYAERGHVYRLLERYHECVRDYSMHLAQQPLDRMVRVMRGLSYARLGLHREAIMDFTVAIERLSASDARGLTGLCIMRAQSLVQVGHHCEAVHDLDRVLRFEPTDIDALELRAKVHCELGLERSAITDYTQCIDILSARFDPRSQQHSDDDDNDDDVNKSSHASPVMLDDVSGTSHALVEVLLNRSSVYSFLNRHEQAIADATAALALNAHCVEALVQRGTSLCDSNQVALALEDFEAALRLDDGCTAARVNRATCLRHLGQFEAAIEAYTEALRIDPECSTFVYVNRGATAHLLGCWAAAMADFDAALAADPECAYAYTNRGILKKRLGYFDEAHVDLKQAADMLSRAIKQRPQATALYYDRGRTLRALGLYAQAIAHQTTAICADHSFAHAYCERGYSHYEAGRFEAAKVEFDRAVELLPTRTYESSASRVQEDC